jgi:hypothetical protein
MPEYDHCLCGHTGEPTCIPSALVLRPVVATGCLLCRCEMRPSELLARIDARVETRCLHGTTVNAGS